MRADCMKDKSNTTLHTKKYRYITIPASIVASILLTTNPYVALADTNTELTEIEKEAIQQLYDEFHLLIESNTPSEEELEGTESADSLPQLIEDTEEIRLIKNNLLNAFENIGNQELTDKLGASDLTVEQLDQIFEEVVSLLVQATDENTEGSIEAVEIPELDSVETETSEEVVEVEETEEVEEATEPESIDVQEEVAVTEAPNQITEAPGVAARTLNATNDHTKNVFYTVRPGDTLDRIARNYNTTTQKLIQLNQIKNPNLIQVGQQILVSGLVEEVPEDLTELNKPLTSTEFIEIVGSHAKDIANEHNLYASVMIAQAALESGYGKSSLSLTPNHNLFGIKGSYNGESVTMQTKEYSDKTGWITIYDAFKKYPSYRESLLDNARLLRLGLTWDANFYAGTWHENAATYEDATAWLEGRYATDPTYATKLNNIIATYNLTQFDKINNVYVPVEPTPTPEPKPEPAPKPEEKPVTPSSGKTYEIKSGDTLSGIARVYNMSVSELKQLNNLKSDLIFVGQTLKVRFTTSIPEPAPKPVETPEKPSTSASTYRVKAGDTLSHIAQRYKMSVSELKSRNNLKSDLIFIGQTLKVKEVISTPTPKPESAPKPVETPTNASTIKVKSGDTLSHIAQTYKMSVSELKNLNNLKSDLIFVGQPLKVKEELSKPTPKPETKPVTPSSSSNTYRVKSGDTLSHIARANNISVSVLKQLNNLRSDLIFVGQSLKVKATNTAPTPKPTTPSTSSGQYTVKSGDTLSHIGLRHNMSVSELKRLNNLKSDLIFIGQKLKVTSNATKSVTPSSIQQTTNTSTGKTYRIVSGDTLSDIASKNNTTVHALKQKNNLKSDLIFVGQTIRL